MTTGSRTDRATPSDEGLAATLGNALPAWVELRRRLATSCAPFSEEWRLAPATGWGLRIKRGSRIIVYLAPREGHVVASFALGGRAVEAARAGGVPDPVLALIEGARRYAEGTGVRIPVRRVDEVDVVLALAAIKIAH
jgi:hypothetical protein